MVAEHQQRQQQDDTCEEEDAISCKWSCVRCHTKYDDTMHDDTMYDDVTLCMMM